MNGFVERKEFGVHRSRALRRAVLAVLGGLAALALMSLPAAASPLDLASFSRTDLRAEAMGNAFSAVARGETALVYNPAGLVQYPFDIKLDAGAAVQGEAGSFFKDTYKLFGSTASATDVQNYLTKYLGKSQYYQAQTNINAVANLSTFHVGFGVGSLHVERYGFDFYDANSNGTFDTTDQLIFTKQALRLKTAAFAFNSFSGQLLTGIALKKLDYTAGTASPTFQDVLLSGNIQPSTTDTSYSGSGYDVGFIWRMETMSFLHGQWSLVANNIGSITMQTGVSAVNVPSSYDVGFSINPPLPIVHLIMAVSMDDVTGAIKVVDPATTLEHKRSTKQRLHMGAELGLFETTTGNNILNLRVGNNRGGATAGFELNLFSGLRLIYARYKDDYGYSGHPEQHSFQTVQLSLGFGF